MPNTLLGKYQGPKPVEQAQVQRRSQVPHSTSEEYAVHLDTDRYYLPLKLLLHSQKEVIAYVGSVYVNPIGWSAHSLVKPRLRWTNSFG